VIYQVLLIIENPIFFIPFTMSRGAMFFWTPFAIVLDMEPTITEFIIGTTHVVFWAVSSTLFRAVKVFPAWLKINGLNGQSLKLFLLFMVY